MPAVCAPQHPTYSFTTESQEGAGITSRARQQDILPAHEPRYKCSMFFNDPGCTLIWKSNLCFGTPKRFNHLSAPESNSSLALILDVRSNDIQMLSSINLDVSLLLCLKVFQEHVFPKQYQFFRIDTFLWTNNQSRKLLKPRMKILVETELGTQFWFGAGSLTFQLKMIFSTGYLKMLFPFTYFFLPIWTEEKYWRNNILHALKCLILNHSIVKNSGG